MDPAPERKTTIKDVARVASVSPATVSLIANERPGICRSTRDRVLKIMQALDYRPNLVARSLVKRRSYAVAMLVTSPLNPIFPELAAGADEVLRKHGYSLSIISTHDDLQTEADELKKIEARGMDGVITSASLLDSQSVKDLVQSGYPVVSALRRVYNCEELDYVTLDNLKGGYMAAEHLIRLGHTRIGIIKGPQNTSTGKERFEGALLALNKYSVPATEELIKQGDYFRESGYKATRSFLGMPANRRPTAICAHNDEMAFGALEALLDKGMGIPEDVAVIGFNNVEATALRSIEITTICQRKLELGRLAAKRLIDKIEKKRGYRNPCHVVLEPKLIIRRSCGFSITNEYQVNKQGSFIK
jgi:LacI family transcriptional regulator